MGLFTKAEMSKINSAAKRSNANLKTLDKTKRTKKNAKSDIDEMSKKVEEYFSDSDAILIDKKDDLNKYVDACIEAGYCAIDTETTGLDRIKDTIVGFSLYYPGGKECYVPNKHKIYIFDDLVKNQLTYEESGEVLQRLVDANVKMIFANADFDISMIYKDFHVDMCDVFYYDVILAWRCLKENEPRNGLKELYSKYVLNGKGDPMKFSDFFSVELFPYCKPQIARLYAANDAKITYELFKWQLPYTIKSNPKCQRNHLESIADIIWNLEFPMVKVCAMMHRNGMYFDMDVAEVVRKRYHKKYDEELADLQSMVQDIIDDMDTPNNRSRPFATGKDFIPTSPKHVQYLCYTLLKLPDVDGGSTGKAILRDFGMPQTDKILAVRSLSVLINSFVDKLTESAKEYDGRIHAQFKSIGADTGRMSCIAEGQRVLTVDRGLVPIQDVRIGDNVYCFDLDERKPVTSVVLDTLKTGVRKCVNVVATHSSDNRSVSLLCTPDHFVRTYEGEWVEAAKLKHGDKLLYCFKHGDELFEPCSSSDELVVNSVDPMPYYNVYDLCIDGHHNFVVQDICVHNSSNPNAQNIPSHATDIRHLFRATPMKEEAYDVGESDEIELKYYDRIETNDGYKPCGELHAGDRVHLTSEDDDVYAVVMSINVNGSDVVIRW